jgi:hypothetical protein
MTTLVIVIIYKVIYCVNEFIRAALIYCNNKWLTSSSNRGRSFSTDYWKKRRGDVIDSINFSKDIWLSVKVNQPQQPEHLPGNWALGWYLTQAKYKTGKRMAQWIHTAMHFDANDKIDRVIQFLDRAPINAATKK